MYCYIQPLPAPPLLLLSLLLLLLSLLLLLLTRHTFTRPTASVGECIFESTAHSFCEIYFSSTLRAASLPV